MALAQHSFFGQGPVAAIQPGPSLSVKKKPTLERSLNERRQRRVASAIQVSQSGFDELERDVLGVSVSELVSRVTKYASGVLSPAYWHAFRAAKRPICVAATELKPRSLARVLKHVANGGTLILDSGTFVYKADHAGMPWAQVEGIYRQIAKAVRDHPD